MRVFAALVTAVLVLLPAHAAHGGAGATFAASFKLDPAPAWQTSAQKSERGSWVKHSSPVVVDLGDGPVIVVADQGGRVSALRYAGGRLTEVWNTGSVIETFIDSSPAVGDLNGDGCPEVVVGAGNEFRPHDSGLHVFDCHGQNHRFWPAPVVPDKANHVGVFSTPAIGDVSGDGRPDIVYGSFNQKIYAKDANGLDLPGWPRENYDTVWSSAALGDVDGDGVREIAIGTDLGGGAPVFGCSRGVRGTVSIFEGDGSYRPNFPRCMDTPIWSTPVLQDVTGDGGLDVIAASNNYLEGGVVVGDPRWIRAWDARTGAQHWATKVATGPACSPHPPSVTSVGTARWTSPSAPSRTPTTERCTCWTPERERSAGTTRAATTTCVPATSWVHRSWPTSTATAKTMSSPLRRTAA